MAERDRITALIDRIVRESGVQDERAREDLRRELWAHFEDADFASDALKHFGSEKEIVRSLRRVHSFERPRAAGFMQDARLAVRLLRRTPGFTVVAVLCLAVGIGATAAVFSWIEGLLLRPFPLVARQDRLVAVTGTQRGGSRDDMSWPDFEDLRRRCTLFDVFIAEKITGATLAVGDRAEWTSGSVVSANYFDALGIRPILGRGFQPGEDVGRNAHPVVVISYQAWKERFGSDPAIVGRVQMLNGLPHTIVGVAPEGFYGTFVGYAFQFWVPASMQAQHIDAGVYHLEDRGARWIEGFARLKPGVSIEQAQQEVSAVAARLETEFPSTDRGRGVRLYPLSQTPFNNAGALRPTLLIALVVVGSVLLIACVNVGTLLLVRALARRREMTVRLALGAGRVRLVRQLLTEGSALAAGGLACGLGLAFAARNMLSALTPPRGVPLMLPASFDWRVIAITGGVCALSTVLFALLPALTGTSIDIAGALRAESATVTESRERFRIRSALVVLQVSLSFSLLVGAALLMRSLHRVQVASPGYDLDHVVTTVVNLFSEGYTADRAKNFQAELIDRLQAVPGIESAAFSRLTPFSYRTYPSGVVAVDGYQFPPDQQPTVSYNVIGPGYLATMGIRLVAGREFLRADDESAPLVVIVDTTMASRFWRDGDPIDRLIKVGTQSMRVVGVAANAKYRNLLEAPEPFFYLPLRQHFTGQTALQIRISQPPAVIAPRIAQEIHAMDAKLPGEAVITMREQLRRTTASQRIAVTMLSAFGAVALVLSGIGLYGVMSSSVAQTRRELAVRMALGADAPRLLRQVLSRAVLLIAAGVAMGSVAALETTRLMGYLLYQVSPRDPVSFGSAFLIVAAASLAACAIPAWRASRVDPLDALRQ